MIFDNFSGAVNKSFRGHAILSGNRSPRMRSFLSALPAVLTLGLCLLYSYPLNADKKPAVDNSVRPLDIVFAVDLSGSTNGIINDIRDNLWLLVSQIGHISPAPDLRIGFVGFSRPSFGKENSYVRILCPLTRDFDFLASELYKLKPVIEKGDQFVSEAIRVSVNNMRWSERRDARKLVFLIGNGMVANNGFGFVKSCDQARQKNIVVHCIYIRKNHAAWIREIPGWRRIADMTYGLQKEAMVNSVDDVRIWKSVGTDLVPVNNRYSNSFIWMGRDSSLNRQVMMTADSGAFHAGRDAFLCRLYYKSSNAYKAKLAGCEMSVSADLVASEPDAYIGTDNFQSRICEQYFRREQIRTQLREVLPEGNLDEIQQSYLTGKMPDDNILHRCLLNTVYRSMGLTK